MRANPKSFEYKFFNNTTVRKYILRFMFWYIKRYEAYREHNTYYSFNWSKEFDRELLK